MGGDPSQFAQQLIGTSLEGNTTGFDNLINNYENTKRQISVWKTLLFINAFEIIIISKSVSSLSEPLIKESKIAKFSTGLPGY